MAENGQNAQAGAAPGRSRKDGLPALDLVLKIFSTIGVLLIPLILGILGNRYAENQKKIDNDRADYDRMILVLDRVTSDKPKEREEGFMMLQYFAENCRLINISLSAMLAHQGDPDPDVANTASRLFGSLVNNNRCPNVSKSITDSAEHNENLRAIALIDSSAKAAEPSSLSNVNQPQLPKRVYIQIGDESQTKEAQQIRQKLIYNGFLVPGIEKVSSMPRRTEIRYFHKGPEMDEATHLAKLIPGAQLRYVPGYSAISADQYELWLVPQTQQDAQAK